MDVLKSDEALPIGSKESTEPSVPLEVVLIDIEADGTLGYASIQNAVPVIRSLRLTNKGAC